MSHDTHQDAGHSQGEQKSKTALTSAFLFVAILVGLFVAAVNFVNVMSHEEEPPAMHTEEASSNQTMKGEDGTGVEKKDTTQHNGAATANDTLTRENNK